MLVLVQAGEGEARASGANITVLEAEPRLRKGDVFFVPVGTSLELAAGAGAPLTLWVAAVNAQAGSSLFYAMSLFDGCVAVCVYTPDILACLIDSPLCLCFLSLGRVVEASVAAANAQTGPSFDGTLVACSVAFAPRSGTSRLTGYFPASLLALCSSSRPAQELPSCCGWRQSARRQGPIHFQFLIWGLGCDKCP